MEGVLFVGVFAIFVGGEDVEVLSDFSLVDEGEAGSEREDCWEVEGVWEVEVPCGGKRSSWRWRGSR